MSFPGPTMVPDADGIVMPCTCALKPTCSQYHHFLVETVEAGSEGDGTESEAAAVAAAVANLPAFTGTYTTQNPATFILAERSAENTGSEEAPVWGAFVKKSRFKWRIRPSAACFYRMQFEVTTWDGVTATYDAYEETWDALALYGARTPCFPDGFDWGDATTYPTLPDGAGYIAADIPAGNATKFIRITAPGPHSWSCVPGITGGDLTGLEGYPFPAAPNFLE